MWRKKSVKIFLFLTILFLIIFFYANLNKREPEIETKKSEEQKEEVYKSNITKNVNYTSQDINGNTYIIDAKIGEIDINNTSIIFLTDVKALIKLKDSSNILITSNFGKYNIDTYDTIFSKNVIIKYLDNKITSEYLDFSIDRNSMIISKNVIYNNKKNILNSDVVEINIKTKDTKIFMNNIDEKVNIKSIN